MDDSSSVSLALLVLSIFLSALITLIYTAINNVRLSWLNDQVDEGNKRAKRLIILLDAKTRLMMTFNLIIAILYVLAGVSAAFAFLVPAANGTAPFTTPVALGLTFFAAVALLMMGSILPESLGTVYSSTLALFFTPLMRALTTLFSPLTWLLLRLSRMIARLFGGADVVNTVTEEEIMTLVNAGTTGGTIEDEERNMIYSVLQLDETNARELMTPRIDIISVEVNSTVTDALALFIESGYSRIPVYEENIDNIVGLLYAKDLLNMWQQRELIDQQTVRDYVRPAHFVPETIPADELLRDLRARNVHMAIVVDEYGGTSGLVTIENLVEEIVGDIRDEYDVDEEVEYMQMSELEYLCDASMDLDDINDLFDLDMDSDETDTLGGWVYFKLGRVPDEGDVIEEEDYTLTVAEIDGRRIRKVLLMLKPEPREDRDAPADNDTETESVSSDQQDNDDSQIIPDAS